MCSSRLASRDAIALAPWCGDRGASQCRRDGMARGIHIENGRRMPQNIDGVMRQIAQATADQQRALKLHPLQRDLSAGLLPRSTYVAWLSQLYFVHRALEWHLGRLRAVVQ